MNTNWENKARKKRNMSLLISVLVHVLIISWIWYSNMEAPPKEDEIDKIENTINDSRESFLQS